MDIQVEIVGLTGLNFTCVPVQVYVFVSHFYIQNVTIFLPRRTQRVLEMPSSPTHPLRWLMCGLQRLPWWGRKPPHWLGDSPKQASCAYLGGGFIHISLFFIPKIGEVSHFDSYFSIWLKPPTSYFLHSPKLTYIAPENSWLEDDPFLLGKPIHGSFGKHPAQKPFTGPAMSSVNNFAPSWTSQVYHHKVDPS